MSIIISGNDVGRLCVWPDRLALLDRKLTEWTEKGERQAYVVRVMRKGEEIFAGAYGYSVLGESKEPARLDHIFPVASNTKSIIAALVLQLMEDGELDVYDPVGKYIEKFNTDETRAIQLWHFITHSSGIADEDHGKAIREYMRNELGLNPPPDNASDEEWTPVLLEAREKLELEPLDDAEKACHDTWEHISDMLPYIPKKPPCQMMAYCNTGYRYLKDILEKVSGKSIDELALDKLFGPLGMSDSHFHLPKEKYDRVIRRAEGTDGYPWQNTEDCFRADHGSGGLKTTAADILRFCEMIRRGGSLDGARILSPVTVKAMTQNLNIAPGLDSWAAWAFGFNYRGVKHDDLNFTRPSTTLDHGGWGGTKFVIDMENELSIALYTVQIVGRQAAFSPMTNIIYSSLY